MKKRIAFLAILSLAGTGLFAQALNFFAPAALSGSIKLKLYAVGGVTPGQPHLVTTGIPMPRGSLTTAGLNTVRVIKNGAELASFAAALTPWRSATQPAVDGQSIRVLQIQFYNQFTQLSPAYDSVVVEWGLQPRQLSLSWTNPLSARHLVTSGSFLAADSVYEPDVIATLPKSFLANGALKTRMEPFYNGVSDTIEDAAAIEAINNWPHYTDMDHGMHNFFYTLLNQGTPISNTYAIQYKTDFEPWLYDRASSMYLLYLRSGNVKHLREAIRNANFYRRQLHPNGIFRLKQPLPNSCTGGNDAMYSVNECLAYTYWFTGDTSLPGWIRKIADIQEQCNAPYQWSPLLSTWTERHNAFRLLANTIAYEITGDISFRNRMQNMVAAFQWHQNGAGGQIPQPYTDGALYHTKGQHGEGAVVTDYIASNWMSVLLTDAMLRAYSQNEDPGIEDFLIRMAHFQRKTARKHTTNLLYDGASYLWSIDYLVNRDGTTNEFTGDEYNHSMEAASAIAWGAWFAKKRGQPYDSLMHMADTLYRTYALGLDEYIRPGNISVMAPVYRIIPPRMYGWQYRPSASFSWLMKEIKTSGTLPGELISFSGFNNGDVNELQWQTGQGNTISRFLLERSPDGNIFSLRKQIENNTGNVFFTYRDSSSPFGTSYYRLQIRKTNGHIVYSPVIIIKKTATATLRVFPNPLQSQLCIYADKETPAGTYHIRLFNASGGEVYHRQPALRFPGTVCLPLKLTPGTYLLLVQDALGLPVHRQKIIVANE